MFSSSFILELRAQFWKLHFGSFILELQLLFWSWQLQNGASWSPRVWTDSSSAMQASKRIGPGSRHLEVCEFYVQGALQSKQIALGKVKGTVNCANFLTKHPKSGTEVRQAMPGLGMYEARDGEDMLSSSKKISVKVSTMTKQHAWKTPTPACVGWIKDQDRAGKTATAYCQDGQLVGCIKALVVLSQIQAVAGQPTDCLSQYEWYALFFLAGIGIGVLIWAIWQLATQFVTFAMNWYGQSSQELKKWAMRCNCTSKISRSPCDSGWLPPETISS